MRLGILFCFITGALLLPAGGAEAQSYTTRIETRPFYGAVVTREQGVRVFRALPPERQVIINPDGTPLSLSFNDTHVYEQSRNSSYNYSNGEFGGAAPYWGSGCGFNCFGRDGGRSGNRFPNNHFHHGGKGVQIR